MLLEQLFPKKRCFVTQLMCSSLLVSLKKTLYLPFNLSTNFNINVCSLCYTYTMHVYHLLYISLHQCNNLLELTIVPSTRTESRSIWSLNIRFHVLTLVYKYLLTKKKP